MSNNIKLRKLIIQIVIIILVLTFNSILVFNYFIKKDVKNYILEKQQETSQEKNNSFDEVIKILDDKRFTGLIKFGTWPIKVEETGKINPFIEFE